MAFTQESVELSRRIGKIMSIISRQERNKILPFIQQATSWDDLPKKVQDIIQEAEKKLSKIRNPVL
jgi:hypothetical protein